MNPTSPMPPTPPTQEERMTRRRFFRFFLGLSAVSVMARPEREIVHAEETESIRTQLDQALTKIIRGPSQTRVALLNLARSA